jgi:hypothetical protein
MSAESLLTGQLEKFVIKFGKKCCLVLKVINRYDLAYRESHFNWNKLSAVLRETSDPPLSSLCLDGHEVAE